MLVLCACNAPDDARSSARNPHLGETPSGLALSRIGGGLAPVYWLDDHTVMFAGQEPWRNPGREKKAYGGPAIFIWDLKANTHTKYADLNPRAYIFYYNAGQIVYSPVDGGGGSEDIAWMVGPMGNETRKVLSDKAFYGSPSVQLALGPRMDAGYRGKEGTTSLVYYLNPGDGMILVATRAGYEGVMQGGEENAVLLRADDSTSVELPIIGRELGYATHISFSAYLRKYVLLPAWHRTRVESGKSGFHADDSHPVYLLSRDGAIETQQIPAGPWAPADVLPSKAGLFWVSSQAKVDAREAGGWLLQGRRVIKVFDYLADAASLSPDGCTLVFAVNTFTPEQDHEVRARNLCDIQPN